LQRHQLFNISFITTREPGAEHCLQRHQLFNFIITREPGAEHCLQRYQFLNFFIARKRWQNIVCSATSCLILLLPGIAGRTLFAAPPHV
jgi:hypothetical protein